MEVRLWFNKKSILEVIFLHVDAIILDATGHFLLHTGEVLEGGKCLHATQVDNNRVGEFDTAYSAPVS
jgi:hypothetical protein